MTLYIYYLSGQFLHLKVMKGNNGKTAKRNMFNHSVTVIFFSNDRV